MPADRSHRAGCYVIEAQRSQPGDASAARAIDLAIRGPRRPQRIEARACPWRSTLYPAHWVEFRRERLEDSPRELRAAVRLSAPAYPKASGRSRSSIAPRSHTLFRPRDGSPQSCSELTKTSTVSAAAWSRSSRRHQEAWWSMSDRSASPRYGSFGGSFGGSSGGGLRPKKYATRIETPYSPHRGIASRSWLSGSGGVSTAEITKATTMK